jgi:hypothetical protein
MFIVITSEESTSCHIDEFNALIESIDTWETFNPTGLDEKVINIIWSNDQVIFQYQDNPSCY